MFEHGIDSNALEHKIDSCAFAAAVAILGDFPELCANEDRAVVAFRLFARVKVSMKGLIRDVDHMQARQRPSKN